MTPVDAFAKLASLLDESLRNWGLKGTVRSDGGSRQSIVVSVSDRPQLAIRRAAADDRPGRWIISTAAGDGGRSESSCASILGVLMEVREFLDAMPEQVRSLRIGSPPGTA